MSRALGVALLGGAVTCSRGASVPTQAPAPAAAPATVAVPPPPLPPAATRDRLLVTENEYQGWRYFQVYCARCHGEDALGTLNAPDLTFSVSADGSITRDSFVVVVRGGSRDKDMQGFRELLDDRQIANLYAYVLARSEGRLGRGRPHRAPLPTP